jgi:hypothetical protein
VTGPNRGDNLETTSTVKIRPSVVCDVTFYPVDKYRRFEIKMM